MLLKIRFPSGITELFKFTQRSGIHVDAHGFNHELRRACRPCRRAERSTAVAHSTLAALRAVRLRDVNSPLIDSLVSFIKVSVGHVKRGRLKKPSREWNTVPARCKNSAAPPLHTDTPCGVQSRGGRRKTTTTTT